MKIGLDYHGVITAKPEFFSRLTETLYAYEYEIHIITGRRVTDELREELGANRICYTHLFSISDYHHQLGTPMTGYDENQPKIDDEIWNRTKAEYCKKHKIDLHIDDSGIYGQFFTTPYAMFKD